MGRAVAPRPRTEAGRPPSGGAPGKWPRLARKVISSLRACVQGTYHGLSATRRFRNAGREKRENEEWVAAASAEATKERMVNYASR